MITFSHHSDHFRLAHANNPLNGQTINTIISLCLNSLANRIEEGAGSKRIARTLASLCLASDTPGFRRISS